MYDLPGRGARRCCRCQIATGKHRGDIVFINRIRLEADKDAFPFEWSRRQFPVRPAVAMVRTTRIARTRLPTSSAPGPLDRVSHLQTINKAQGQTLQRVGIYLSEP